MDGREQMPLRSGMLSSGDWDSFVIDYEVVQWQQCSGVSGDLTKVCYVAA